MAASLASNAEAVSFSAREHAVGRWMHLVFSSPAFTVPFSTSSAGGAAAGSGGEQQKPACLTSWSAMFGPSMTTSTAPSSGGESVVSQLMDGVVLCYLLAHIRPRSIPRVHENTEGPWKIRENISFALTALEELGVSRWDLFSIPDLQQLKNPCKVVASLELLARVLNDPLLLTKPVKSQLNPDLKSHPLPDFQATLSSLPSGWPASFRFCSLLRDPRAVLPLLPACSLRNAKSLRGGSSSNPLSLSSSSSSSLALSSSSSDAPATAPRVRRPPATLRDHDAARTIQKYVRGYLARRQYQFMVRAAAFRTKVATEICETEEAYVTNLAIIGRVYANPLRELAKPIVAEDFIKRIFADLDVILAYSEQLRVSLRAALAGWSSSNQNSQCMGSIFAKLGAFFRVYTQYCNGYSDRISALEAEREKNRKFAEFLAAADLKPEVAGRNLPAFLIMPIQRVPRYEMLLRELLKYTWADHPDFGPLNQAFDCVREAAVYINDRRREAENIRKVLQIQETFKGKHSFAQPHRRYVDEAPVSLEEQQQQQQAETANLPYHIFLFNDLLIVTKPKDKKRTKFSVKHVLVLQEWALSADVFVKGRGIQFSSLRNGTEPPLLICFASAKVCMDYVKQIRKLYEKLAKNIGSAEAAASSVSSPPSSSSGSASATRSRVASLPAAPVMHLMLPQPGPAAGGSLSARSNTSKKRSVTGFFSTLSPR